MKRLAIVFLLVFLWTNICSAESWQKVNLYNDKFCYLDVDSIKTITKGNWEYYKVKTKSNDTNNYLIDYTLINTDTKAHSTIYMESYENGKLVDSWSLKEYPYTPYTRNFPFNKVIDRVFEIKAEGK